MPETLSSPRGRRWTRLLLAFAGAITALAVMAPAGHANFTTGKCQGTAISGRGASFQNTAQAGWISYFQNTYCADVGVFPAVTYTGSGSGSGLQVMGRRSGACPCPPGNADGSQSRNQPERYAASDDPPPPTTVSQINMGTDTVGDEGTIHVIPAALGSATLDVNFPTNCDRSLLPASAQTDPAAANAAPFDDRVRFTRSQIESIMAGDAGFTNWKDVFPTLATDANCNVAITRVVRFDDSGTTFNVKGYLDSINPGRGWHTTYNTPDTRTWPNASVGARADCGGATGPMGTAGAPLTSACSNGAGALLDKLKTVDGGIGYADVATARSRAFDIVTTSNPAARDDKMFWTQGQNPGGNWTEPTTDPQGFTTTGQHGANCANATITGNPSSTLGDWSSTSAWDSNTGAYVICTLTYELAFDDNSPPYSLQGCGFSCEEMKARSVKDYMSAIVSDGGQRTLPPNDYAELPQNILDISRAGVNSICYDKAGTGGCPTTYYYYPRPKGATPLRISFVPAYNQCTAANSTHGAPLAFPSCAPPVQSSSFLTVGTPDNNGAGANSIGSAVYNALTSDVSVSVSTTDVRCMPGETACGSANAADGADYTGQLQLNSSVRITDRINSSNQGEPATVQDLSFPATVPCAGTASTSLGSTCSVNTSFNAITPGTVTAGKRAIWELGQAVLNDGGSDGLHPGSAFEREGVFIP